MGIHIFTFILGLVLGAVLTEMALRFLNRPKTEEKQPEPQEQGDVYSGVFHVFKKNGKKHERPVYVRMSKRNKDEHVFYEYNQGKEINLSRSKNCREEILKILEGECDKTKTFIKKTIV